MHLRERAAFPSRYLHLRERPFAFLTTPFLRHEKKLEKPFVFAIEGLFAEILYFFEMPPFLLRFVRPNFER
jgi:hypothetical protein